MDGIPANSKLTLLPNNLICTKRISDITIPYQPLRTPQSNTEGCTCGLNCEAATDIGKNKAATAEDTFNVNRCSYGIKVSAQRQTRESQKLTRDREVTMSHV